MKLLSCLPKCALLSAVDDRESLHQLVCHSDIIKCTTKWQLNVCKETNFLINDLLLEYHLPITVLQLVWDMIYQLLHTAKILKLTYLKESLCVHKNSLK